MQDTDAFVLVYDICSPDSFDYVKALRQRIAETRWVRGGRWRGRHCWHGGPEAWAGSGDFQIRLLSPRKGLPLCEVLASGFFGCVGGRGGGGLRP